MTCVITFATCCCTSLYQLCLSHSIQFHHTVDPRIRRIVGFHPLCWNCDTKTYGVRSRCCKTGTLYVYICIGRRILLAAWGHILRLFVGHPQPLDVWMRKSSEAPCHSSPTRDICKMPHKSTTKNSTDTHQYCLNTIMIPIPIGYSPTGHDIMNCIP